MQGSSTLGEARNRSFLNLSQVCQTLWSLTDVIVYKTLACQPTKLQQNVAKEKSDNVLSMFVILCWGTHSMRDVSWIQANNPISGVRFWVGLEPCVPH